MIRPTPPEVHAREVTEVFRAGNPGYWVHPEWETRFPWLIQGTTGRGRDGDGGAGPWTFALFSEPPGVGAPEAWEALGESLGCPHIALAQQVHGRSVSIHGTGGTLPARDVGRLIRPGEDRRTIAPDSDGHVTGARGVLLGVTVADCVPVFLVDPEKRAIGLLHAGWRGAVEGVLEEGVDSLQSETEADPGSLYLHLGPAICGECYEVGEEVHTALGLPRPNGPSPVDLRAHLAARAIGIGLAEGRVTQSTWCTLCSGSPFYSHRRGDKERQVGFLAVR